MMNIKPNKQFFLYVLFLILGLILGFILFLLTKQKRFYYTAPNINQDEWVSSSLHFNFQYPKGWHVFSDGSRFSLDKEPIYYFPHQSYRVVEGRVIKDIQDEVKKLVSFGYKQVYLNTPNDMFKNMSCYEDSEKVIPEGPFPTRDGKLACFITVAWGDANPITYMFEGNNTNVDENRFVYLKFIESVRPVE